MFDSYEIKREMLKLVLILFYVSTLDTKSIKDKCAYREYPTSIVCVCNETYCDSLDVEKPKKLTESIVVSSSKAGKRFDVTSGIEKSNIYPTVIRIKRMNTLKSLFKTQTIELTIDRDKKYQTIVGFGNAFTGTVSYLVDQMPAQLKQKFYSSYYSQNDGIGFTMMRIPIGGCDFDLVPWAYNEQPENELILTNFSRLDDRDLHRIEQINELVRVTKNLEIKYIGTAWSSPRWMKTNNEWTGPSSLKLEYYQTWADYHLQYLRLMAEKNIKFWAISTGNEPLNGIIGWFFVHFMSLGWLPENQGKWVAENLGPTLNNSELRNVKLFAGDDQRYTFPWWFDKMKRGSPNALDFVSGLAVHWYWDQMISPVLLDRAHEKFPDKIILNTEACIGDKPWEEHKPSLGSWSRAGKYALAIIQDLHHHVSGWIDWNLCLNEFGGPTYVNNTVDAPIVINSTTHREFYKQPMFYAMGHFAKFIPPGSIRIEAKLTGTQIGKVKVVAFVCPDDAVTVILHNHSNQPKIVHYTDALRGRYEFQIDSYSINTFYFV